MPPTRVVAVALLLVLSGCQGIVPWLTGGDSERTPTPVETEFDGEPTASPVGDGTDTRTDSRTETDTETGPDYLAPGLTDEGVLNATLLLARHFDVLERESGDGTYTAVFWNNRTDLDFPPTGAYTTRTQYVVQHPDRWHRSRTATNLTADETSVTEEWADESDWLYRADRPEVGVEYDAMDRSAAPGHPETLERELRLILQNVDPRRSVDVTVETQERDGTTVYVVTDTTRVDSTTATTTVTIREDGFIEKYAVESITNPPSGEASATIHHLTFGFHPNETLEPPPWAEEARRVASDDDADND